MTNSRWTTRLIWTAAVASCLYIVTILLIGPPFLARQHPFTWSLNFQEKVERLAAQNSTEEAFIEALLSKGFRMRIPPDNPISYRENGGQSISYVDRNKTYTTYADLVQAHERFQAALPENYVEHPRSALVAYGFLVCERSYFISWRLSGGEIVDLVANDGRSCL